MGMDLLYNRKWKILRIVMSNIFIQIPEMKCDWNNPVDWI